MAHLLHRRGGPPTTMNMCDLTPEPDELDDDGIVNLELDDKKTKPPGAVGVSIALEKFLPNNPSSDVGLSRIENSISVLVCSKGGGGLLNERMELVAELWEANIKAQFVPQEDPSLQEQYEYASDHDIKCLVFITEAGLSQTDLVKVRHLDARKEKDVEKEEIVKFLSEAISLQFKNPTIWS